jgi:ankyrin repeat protein
MQDYDGNTALIEASQNGYAESARVLLNHGANVHYQNRVRNLLEAGQTTTLFSASAFFPLALLIHKELEAIRIVINGLSIL